MVAPARRAALGAGLVATLALGTAVVIKFAPEWLASKGELTPAQHAEDLGRVRTALLATLAGYIAILGAYYTARTFALNRRGQVTERFTRAIDQLGSQALDVRIGGLYALHRLSQESREDYVSIMEIFAAYVRDQAPAPGRVTGQTGIHLDGNADSPDTGRPVTDVQVVLNILTRPRDRGHPPLVIDLSLTKLSGAALNGAHLAGADLRGAQFAGADLAYANLRGVALEGADLLTARRVDLAYLTEATFDADTVWPADFDVLASGAVKTGVPRRLVLCCDSTWTRRDRTRVHAHRPTNVAKVASRISAADMDGNPQQMYFLAGVRNGPALRFVSRDIVDGYRFLVGNYHSGDHVYMFGFSRGAYVARSISGLVQVAGIVRPEHNDRVPEAYDLYRSRNATAGPRGIAARTFRSRYAHPEVDITFIGVWDTAGALGIPIGGWRAKRSLAFHDTDLSTHIRFAYQALALDEQRSGFRPALWRQHPNAPNQTLEQVWFPGSHHDVGGGYRDTSLSDITLLWMMERASRAGLVVNRDHFLSGDAAEDVASDPTTSLTPNPLGPIHDARKGVYRLHPPYHRPLDSLDGSWVSSTAIRRFESMPGYKPRNLERYLTRGGSVATDAGPGEGEAL